jgi:hypothetical protein
MCGDTALPIDTSSIPFEFISESLQKKGTILETAGIRGTRQHPTERTRSGPYTVSGQLTFHPSPVMMDFFLPMIMGAPEATDVFAFAETLVTNYLAINRIGKMFTYAGVTVNKATFRGRAGQLLELALDVEAQTETVAAASGWPSLTMPTDYPYVMSDGVLTLVGSTRSFSEFEITIDNVLTTDRFMNSTTRSEIPATDQIVTFKCGTPYTSAEVDLYNQTLLGSAASLVFTNADSTGKVLTFTFGKIQFPDMSPVVAGKSEIPLMLDGVARKTGSTAALSITNANA